MLNMDFGEIVLVLLVAFLVVGPKDLPKVARWLGRMVRKMRDFLKEFKKEVGWDDIVGDISSTAGDVKKTLSEADLRDQFQGVTKDINKSFSGMKSDIERMDKEMKAEAKKEAHK